LSANQSAIDASTPPSSIRLCLFRWTVAITAVLDALLALALAIAGIWFLSMGATGLESAGHREEFAAGMIVGGLAWVSWFSAAVLAGLAFMCWRIFAQIRRSGRWRWTHVLMLLLALAPALAAVALFLLRPGIAAA
jgi:hypothetical protein